MCLDRLPSCLHASSLLDSHPCAAGRLGRDDLWQGDPDDRAVRAVARFAWDRLVPEWDDELEEMAAGTS